MGGDNGSASAVREALRPGIEHDFSTGAQSKHFTESSRLYSPAIVLFKAFQPRPVNGKGAKRQ